MATFTAISEKTQSATAMRRVLNYVMQDKKNDSIRRHGLDPIFSNGRVIESDEPLERDDAYRTKEYDERTESQRSDAVETQTEMGGGWNDIAVNGLYLAADLAMIGGKENDKHNTKNIRERKQWQKKKQVQDSQDDGGMQMNM